MTDRTSFKIAYGGPLLDSGEMDVRDLAPALLALGKTIEIANELINGPDVVVSVKVRGSFKTSSFGVDVVVSQSILEQVRDFFLSQDGVALTALMTFLGINVKEGCGDLLWLLRKLKGRTPKEVVVLSDRQVAIIVDGERIVVDSRVTRLMESNELRKNLEQAISAPLDKEGIDEVKLISEDVDTQPIVIPKSDAPYLRRPALIEETLAPNSARMFLSLVSVSFQKGNKWRVSDGSSDFFVTISDTQFLDRVNSGREQFSKNDLVIADVETTQRVSGGQIRIDRNIVKVIEHRRTPKQLSLFSPPSPIESESKGDK